MKNAPSRDTIILWSAVIAGIGLLALLVRHAATYGLAPAEQCSFSVTENAEHICDTVNEFKEEFNQKFDDFKANPPVQKVRQPIA